MKSIRNFCSMGQKLKNEELNKTYKACQKKSCDSPAEKFMKIRKATMADLDEILATYDHARNFMRENGNPRQWGSVWPPERLVRQDIKRGYSYVCTGELGKGLLAVFFYAKGSHIEPCYDHIEGGSWTGSDDYGVVHRIATSGNGKGVGSFCISWAYDHCQNLRMDTHPDNRVMQHTLLKNGFIYRGIIHVEEDNDPRYAYEKVEMTDNK